MNRGFCNHLLSLPSSNDLDTFSCAIVFSYQKEMTRLWQCLCPDVYTPMTWKFGWMIRMTSRTLRYPTAPVIDLFLGSTLCPKYSTLLTNLRNTHVLIRRFRIPKDLAVWLIALNLLESSPLCPKSKACNSLHRLFRSLISQSLLCWIGFHLCFWKQRKSQCRSCPNKIEVEWVGLGCLKWLSEQILLYHRGDRWDHQNGFRTSELHRIHVIWKHKVTYVNTRGIKTLTLQQLFPEVTPRNCSFC